MLSSRLSYIFSPDPNGKSNEKLEVFLSVLERVEMASVASSNFAFTDEGPAPLLLTCFLRFVTAPKDASLAPRRRLPYGRRAILSPKARLICPLSF